MSINERRDGDKFFIAFCSFSSVLFCNRAEISLANGCVVFSINNIQIYRMKGGGLGSLTTTILQMKLRNTVRSRNDCC